MTCLIRFEVFLISVVLINNEAVNVGFLIMPKRCVINSFINTRTHTRFRLIYEVQNYCSSL